MFVFGQKAHGKYHPDSPSEDSCIRIRKKLPVSIHENSAGHAGAADSVAQKASRRATSRSRNAKRSLRQVFCSSRRLAMNCRSMLFGTAAFRSVRLQYESRISAPQQTQPGSSRRAIRPAELPQRLISAASGSPRRRRPNRAGNPAGVSQPNRAEKRYTRHFFPDNAARTTPLGSFTSKTVSQMIMPSATADKPR